MDASVAVLIPVLAVILFAGMNFFRRKQADRNSDPVNLVLMNSLILRAQNELNHDEFRHQIESLFTLYGINLNRVNVANKLIWASTMVDATISDSEVKRRSKEIAMSMPNEF